MSKIKGTNLLHQATRDKIADPKERSRLATLAQNGDRKAMNELVGSLNGLIIKWANKYFRAYYLLARNNSYMWSIEDVYMMVVEGVVKGINKFDENHKGASLIACCENWVRAVVGNEFELLTARDFGSGLRGLAARKSYQKAFNALKYQNSQDPSDEELAEFLGWSLEKVYKTKESLKLLPVRFISVDERAYSDNDNERTLIENIADESADFEEEIVIEDIRGNIKGIIDDYLKDAQPLDVDIVRSRLMKDKADQSTFREIAQRNDLSIEGARQRFLVNVMGELQERLKKVAKEFFQSQ